MDLEISIKKDNTSTNLCTKKTKKATQYYLIRSSLIVPTNYAKKTHQITRVFVDRLAHSILINSRTSKQQKQRRQQQQKPTPSAATHKPSAAATAAAAPAATASPDSLKETANSSRSSGSNSSSSSSSNSTCTSQ